MPKQTSSVPVVSGGGPELHSSLKGMVSKSELPSLLASMGMNKQVAQAKVQSDPPAYARMMADPLNAQPVGKPDDNAYPTNTLRIRDVYDVVVPAGAAEMTQVHGPSVNAGSYIAPTITAAAVTSHGAGSNSGYYTSLNTDNMLYRPLIYVVQWIPAMSANTGSGNVFMGMYPGTSAINGVPVQSVASYFDDNGLVGPADEMMTTIVRPLQMATFSNMTTVFGTSFPGCFVALSGVPVGNLGKIVVTRIIETIPIGGTLPSLNAKHTPCDMYSCCIAANIVGQDVSHVTGEKGYEKLVDRAMKLAKTATRVYTAYSSGGASELARMLT